MITEVSFGRLVINGKPHTSDLKIFPDGRVKDGWWRKSGHRLAVEDVADLLAAGPHVLVAGTGINGRMRPETEMARACKKRKIRLVAEKNDRAAQLFNELSKQTLVAACFHLTC
jgi:hypothetical protein